MPAAPSALRWAFSFFFLKHTGSQGLWCVVSHSPVSNLAGRQVQECGARMRFRSIQGWLWKLFVQEQHRRWMHIHQKGQKGMHRASQHDEELKNTKVHLNFTYILGIIFHLAVLVTFFPYVFVNFSRGQTKVEVFMPKIYVLSHSYLLVYCVVRCYLVPPLLVLWNILYVRSASDLCGDNLKFPLSEFHRITNLRPKEESLVLFKQTSSLPFNLQIFKASKYWTNIDLQRLRLCLLMSSLSSTHALRSLKMQFKQCNQLPTAIMTAYNNTTNNHNWKNMIFPWLL